MGILDIVFKSGSFIFLIMAFIFAVLVVVAVDDQTTIGSPFNKAKDKEKYSQLASSSALVGIGMGILAVSVKQ